MGNNLLVAYDLNTPRKDYDSVFNAIKALGSWAKVQKSVWYVDSQNTCEPRARQIDSWAPHHSLKHWSESHGLAYVHY